MRTARSIFTLGAIMAFRLLGLFMILPIFAVAARHYTGSTEFLIGLALGIYGFTQACLQIPFGHWSDRLGRKPVIAIGLLLFLIGSVVAAMADSITGLILGRALQGTGAVGSTILAFVADLTPDESRTKAMAFIGMLFGFAFMIAIIVGPLVAHLFHLSGIFWLTAIFALMGMALLLTLPKHKRIINDSVVETTPQQIGSVIKNSALLKLNAGILLQHASLTTLFMAVPFILHHSLSFNNQQQTWLYLVVFILAFLFMVPFVIIGEKKQKLKKITLLCIGFIFIGEVLLALIGALSWWYTAIGLLIFFTGFTVLEAIMPSMVSKIAPLAKKGTAMGVYSTSQFAGIFIGGVLSGLAYRWLNVNGVLALGLIIALVWFIVLSCLRNPPAVSTKTYSFTTLGDTEQAQIRQLPGVLEMVTNQQAKLLYLKVNKAEFQEEALHKLLEHGTL